jgi:hypothetical protein
MDRMTPAAATTRAQIRAKTRAKSAEARTRATVDTAENGAQRLAGLAIVSVLPALFWTLLLAVAGNAVGHPFDPLALATIGAAIAAFLAAVVSALRED